MAAVTKGFVGGATAPAKEYGFFLLCFHPARNLDLKGSFHLKGSSLIDFKYGLFLLHPPSL